MPERLADACVELDVQRAFLTFVSGGQINFQVPDVQLSPTVTVRVLAQCGTAAERKSAPVEMQTQAATPEFLYWTRSGSGRNPIVAVNSVTGDYVGSASLIPGLQFQLMIVQHRPPLHLSYCLNIHPGESWAENLRAIREKAGLVRQLVSAGQWFGLGLRISAQAAEDLSSNPELRAEALDAFSEAEMYPFSVNAFPYGRFHGGTVKEHVYSPDWRMLDRRNYTFQVADIL